MAEKIPILVQHVALAIYESGDVSGSPTLRMTGAMDIARHRLVEYGFLRLGSEKGSVDSIRLTAKGSRRDAHHRGHGGKEKYEKFAKLYALIAPAHDTEADDQVDLTEPAKADEGDTWAQRSAKTKARHARVAMRAASPRKRAKRVRRAKSARARTL
jgi:hypothetical protein